MKSLPCTIFTYFIFGKFLFLTIIFYSITHQLFSYRKKKAMAIFGAITVRVDYYGFVIFQKDVNDWDIFCNYFFAVLFILVFFTGLVQPLIVYYHSRQQRTTANILFILISVLDTFRSLYFPVILVPKLLAPIGDIEDYMQHEYEGWFGLLNSFLAFLSPQISYAMLLLLCGFRYSALITTLNPTANLKPMKILAPFICLTGAMTLIGYWIWGIFKYRHSGFVFARITQSAFPANMEWLVGSNDFLHASAGFFLCMVLLSVIFSILSVQFLRKSVGQTSNEFSNRHLKRSVISILVMNTFSTFLLVLNIFWLYFQIKHKSYYSFPTYIDALRFTALYGFPLTQAAFNAVSFSIISSSFQSFVKNLSLVKKFWPVGSAPTNQRPQLGA